MTRTSKHVRPGAPYALRGQSVAEFALVSVILFGLIFGTIDLGRIGFAQHTLDGAAYDLARSLSAISNTNSTPGNGYTPTPLDPNGTYTQGLIAAAIAQAAHEAGNGVSPAALTPSGGSFGSGTTTLTNSSIAVVGTPNLLAPTEITVSITETVGTVVGVFLRGQVVHLSASSSAITSSGQ